MERQELRQEVEAVPDPVDTHANSTDVAALKAKLAMVKAKRDALRSTPPRPKKVQRTDRKGSPVIASTPNLVPAELEDWLKGLQADLQEALEFGEGERVLELTSKLWD